MKICLKMKKNKGDIFVWYECDYSGGPDWSLIDLVKNWPDRKQKFVVFVNKNHEGIKLLQSKSDKNFIIKIIPKYFYFSYWNNVIKKINNSIINNLFSLPILIISSIFIFIISFGIFLNKHPKAILFSNGGYPGGFSNFPAITLTCLS